MVGKSDKANVESGMIVRLGRLAIAGGVLLLAGSLALPAMAQSAKQLPSEDVEAIEKIIRDYLLRKPEVLIEAMDVLEKRRKEIALARQREMIAANRPALFEDKNSFTVGSAEADVTIVEFFDYRCPYCKRALSTVMTTIERDPNVRMVFKEYPILGEDSVIAARAAIASMRQGKYLEYHNALMQTRGNLDQAAVLQVAAEVGLDTKVLQVDMNRPEVSDIISANRGLAQTLGVTGTPAFIIGDTLVPGALTQRRMADLIEQARAN